MLALIIKNNIKNNKLCSDLHKLSEKLLKQKMIHALGHGIGMEVHEPPTINSKSKDKIRYLFIFSLLSSFCVSFFKKIQNLHSEFGTYHDSSIA